MPLGDDLENYTIDKFSHQRHSADSEFFPRASLTHPLACARHCESAFVPCRSACSRACTLRCCGLSVLAAVCLLASQPVHSQEAETAVAGGTVPATNMGEATTPPATDAVVSTRTMRGKQPMESELSLMGMIPDGDYRLFSATVRCTAWTVGMEYDRRWGHFLNSRVDYVIEALPFVLLSQPAISDFWGNAYSPNQELVHGVSLSPFGFRFLWRSDKAIKPYIIGKLGTAVFAKKAFSPNASYANFNVQAALGVQIRMTNRVDLRVDPFEFFHVSNGYLAASNPGMDELGTRVGISYRLEKKVQ